MNVPCLKFGGATSDRIDCGSDGSIDNLDPMTMAAWVFPTTLTSTRCILSKATGTTAGKLFRLNGTTGNLEIRVVRATTNTSYITSDTPLSVLSRWVFVATTFDSSQSVTGHIYWTPFGQQVRESTYGTTTAGSGAVTSEATENFRVSNNSGLTISFQGSIGPCMYLRQALSLTDLQYISYRILDRDWRPHGRLGCRIYLWPGKHSTAVQRDMSGYGNMGTVTGAVPNTSGLPRRVPWHDAAGSVIAGAAVSLAHIHGGCVGGGSPYILGA